MVVLLWCAFWKKLQIVIKGRSDKDPRGRLIIFPRTVSFTDLGKSLDAHGKDEILYLGLHDKLG